MKQKQQPETNVIHNSGELPLLMVNVTQGTGEFDRCKVELTSQGWNMQEAREGLEFLLERLGEIKEHAKVDKTK